MDSNSEMPYFQYYWVQDIKVNQTTVLSRHYHAFNCTRTPYRTFEFAAQQL